MYQKKMQMHLTEKVTEKYPDVDVDAQFGGQPIYYYVLAVE